jgi:hypothetical protein
MDGRLRRKLLHADGYFLVQQPCWITFGVQVINQPLMATCFTPIDSSSAILPVHVGHSKLLSLLIACFTILIIVCCICSPRPQQPQRPAFHQQPLPNRMGYIINMHGLHQLQRYNCWHTTVIVGIHNSAES